MILVCGDFMLDQYWFGEVTRISPEAPVPVISVKRVEEREGAAANVAANIRAMGVECREEFGTQDQQVTKIRLIAKGQQTMRVDFDHPQNRIRNLNLDGVSIVVFVDYGKGALGKVSDLIIEAVSAGVKVLVDPKGYNYLNYAGADVLKPNLDEMRMMVGGWIDEDDLEKKARKIIAEASLGAILLTRAADGMTLYTQDGAKHFPAEAKIVVDVTGAGETAIAALGVGLHRGLSLEDASLLANKAAGIKVGMFGPCAVVV